MNSLDSTITNYLTVRDLIRDNTEDPKVLLMAVDLLEHFIDTQDKAFKKAWEEVVGSTTDKYTDDELDAMCDHAAYQESKEQIYKNYRAAIDEWNKLNDKYKDLERSHEELQDLFYQVDGELDELKVKYANCQKNYHAVVNNVMNTTTVSK